MIERIKTVIENSGLSSEYLSQHDAGWIVENQTGKIIGYAGVERRGSNVYLQSLAVEKPFRNLGIGQRLVEKAYEYIEEGDTLIALTLFWNNDFYSKCGFNKMNAKQIKDTDDVSGRIKHKYCTAWGRKK